MNTSSLAWKQRPTCNLDIIKVEAVCMSITTSLNYPNIFLFNLRTDCLSSWHSSYSYAWPHTIVSYAHNIILLVFCHLFLALHRLASWGWLMQTNVTLSWALAKVLRILYSDMDHDACCHYVLGTYLVLPSPLYPGKTFSVFGDTIHVFTPSAFIVGYLIPKAVSLHFIPHFLLFFLSYPTKVPSCPQPEINSDLMTKGQKEDR